MEKKKVHKSVWCKETGLCLFYPLTRKGSSPPKPPKPPKVIKEQ